MSATAEHYAKEAQRLLADEVLTEAFYAVRREAQEALCKADAAETKEIMRLQAIANCIEEVRLWLNAQIIAQGAMDGGVSATNEPTRKDPGS